MGVVQYIDKPSTAIAKKERKPKRKAKQAKGSSALPKRNKSRNVSKKIKHEADNSQKGKVKCKKSTSRDEQTPKDASQIDLEELLGKQKATGDQLTIIREQSEKAVTLQRRMASGEDLLKTLKKEYHLYRS